ncbi:aminopeptidase N-like [Lasioglossum baleicum]|uniref:aminopeptidase N-like n=1 Tax=Lasioglossum baleicum TaxID=434251 RepID=UPI003FCE590A
MTPMTTFGLFSLIVLSSVIWTDTDAVYVLQQDSKPISYILHLEPDIMDNHFVGSVTIDFTMLITTSMLVFHQKDLLINRVEIEGIAIRKWHPDDDMEELIIYCESDLMKDHIYRVKVDYEGELTEWRQGFYKSRYITRNETK